MSTGMPTIAGRAAVMPELRPDHAGMRALDQHLVIHQAMAWVLQRGAPPTPDDWEGDEGWPKPERVTEIFGDWSTMLEASGVFDSVLGATMKTISDELAAAMAARDEAQARLERRERELTKREDRVSEREAKRKGREQDLDRRAEAAQARLKDARDRERAAERRAAELEARLSEAERKHARDLAEAETRVSVVPPGLTAEKATTAPAHETRERTDVDQARERESALQAHLVDLEDQLQTEHRRSAALAHALASRAAGAAAIEHEVADGSPQAGAESSAAPKTMLEAVERAAGECVYLKFAANAFASAADSPFRRPADVLDRLLVLDELAAEWEDGDLGKSLSDRALELGLNWRGGVSVTARHRAPAEYAFEFEGHALTMGPHVALGGGSGAGLCARVYLAAPDGSNAIPRALVIGHVGRHLPDAST